MEQRNDQARRVTEGDQDAGRGVQRGYGVPDDAAAAEADRGQTMAADPEAGIVEDVGARPDGDVLIVDSVIEDEGRIEFGARWPEERADAPGLAGDASPADQSARQSADRMQMAPGSPDLSRRWHEIQATFVDDPRGSVELAAAEAREAVASFLVAVNEQQESLLSSSGRAASDGNTEQLRSALQGYRTLCQTIEGFAGRLTQPLSR